MLNIYWVMLKMHLKINDHFFVVIPSLLETFFFVVVNSTANNADFVQTRMERSNKSNR